MHTEVSLYRIRCPECGAEHVGFIGDNEDGSFYCDAPVIAYDRKGNDTIERCGETWEKIRHLPEDNILLLQTIKAEDVMANWHRSR